MNSEKDTLVKLLEIAHEDYYEHFDAEKTYYEAMADRLIANGVKVPTKEE